MVDQGRARRLQKRINAIVALAIEREIKDPGLAGVTIVDTKVTAAAALERARGALRSKVGAGTGVRFTPTLTFARDTTSDNVQRMEELLARARAADAELARVREGAKPAGEADPYRDQGSEDEPARVLDGVGAEDSHDGDRA